MAKALKRHYPAEALLANRAAVDNFKLQYDGKRLQATRKLAGFRFLAGDLHTHSLYSDGRGSVNENWAVARTRGLDFMFATDHQTVRQKAVCKGLKGVWHGQEPGLRTQHVVILDNDRRFVTTRNLARVAARLRKQGLFFFFPHPTGWFPGIWYSPEGVAELDDAGREFAIEILNGIHRTEPFFSEWDVRNAELWDRHLCRGCRVIGLGASDAHMPASVGTAWTGVPGARLEKASILKALRTGRVFASSGPAINLTSGRTPMGGSARPRQGKLTLRVECADAYGLNWMRILRDGREVKRFHYKGKPHAVQEARVRVTASSRYVRAECAAQDDRRAYANPIYLVGA